MEEQELTIILFLRANMKLAARIKNGRTGLIRFLLGLKRPSKRSNLHWLHQRGETVGDLIIREAGITDIPQLAALHVKTWNQTYWMVKYRPDVMIREHQWKEQFRVDDGSWFCLVVENKKHELIGFAMGKRYAHADLPHYSGELNKIYLLQEYQRLGLGRRLVAAVARRFSGMGINNMVLFGVPQNPSCYFHEAMGGKRLYGANGEFHGGYGWSDLLKLAAANTAE